MKRLFVALDLPEAVRAALPSPGAGWRAIPKENLHVTLAFLGRQEDPAAVIGAVRVAMRPVGALALGRAVHLPSRRPRVLAVEVEGDVAGLQRAVSDALAASGLYAPEKRRYRPHVTIGRARDAPSLELPEVPPVRFLAPSVSVIESRLSPKGARYEALATFPVPARR